MENKVTYTVLVKYIDSRNRERRYSRDFDSYNKALAYYMDKWDNVEYSCDMYFFKHYKKGATTYCDVLKNDFRG